jgi:hypothetical protein
LAKTYHKLEAVARSLAVARLSIADSFPGREQKKKSLSAVSGFFFFFKPPVTFGRRHKEEEEKKKHGVSMTESHHVFVTDTSVCL